ncbi:3-oxoadipyl-CoA/3-oxo-5,6-dehydrosuberyl-CoA thiolase [mine drainage metagenome]|uniref:3-oxoadipyl-CoA/3-oxo-5,6-dehydrosuberyl-CoA thiolase n=1 Tax=mine drainage metagenome TaxID=410659 RepID=A0A1J5QIK6_9ZZZZ
MNRQPVLVGACRTPFGRYRGGLSAIRPDDLLGLTLATLHAQVPQIDLAEVDDVIMGDSNQAGEDNRNVARMGALLAGFPPTVPGLTLNRLCGSGAEAIVQGARAIKSGDADVIFAGGVESMSRAPYVLPKSDVALDPRAKLEQTTVGWRMVNPAFPKNWTDSLGACAERTATVRGIGRAAQDAWSLRSHELAASAADRGLHSGYLFEVNQISVDESIRRDTSLAKLAALPSAFSDDGSVTAGNSSPLNDGAVAAALMEARRANEIGLEILGEIRASVVVATEPDEFAIAPVYAMRKLLARTGLRTKDIDLFEINEAFAAMVLSVLHEMPEIPLSKVNPNGGAIAIGHPVGASAARVVIDTCRELRRRGGGLGIATACIGVGLGIAVLVEVK